MKQLSWMDHMFFLFESPRTPSQVAMVLVYDPSTAPSGQVTFEDLTRRFRERLPLVGIFRRRAVFVPLGLDQAYWLEDPNFDLDYHLRHIALPKPGDWRQFCIQVARLNSRPLDLTRPPWECTMIEGLDGIDRFPKGSFALSLKIHHAAIDGIAGAELVNAINDQSPDAPPAPIEDRWRPESEPTPWELLARSCDPRRHPTARRDALGGRQHQPSCCVSYGAPRPERVATVPRTRFNGKVTAHRVFDAVRIPARAHARDQGCGPRRDGERRGAGLRRRRACCDTSTPRASVPRRRWSRPRRSRRAGRVNARERATR